MGAGPWSEPIGSGAHPADRLAGAPLDGVKLAAAVLMLVDHVNAVLFTWGVPLMWHLGRIAFPLFCLALACNVARGADPGRYLVSLLVVGIATQPVFALAFDADYANILFTLAAGLALGEALHRWPAALQHGALAAGVAVAWLWPNAARTGVDFGLAGILLPAVLIPVLRGNLAHLPWLLAVLVGLNAHAGRPPEEPWLRGVAVDAAFVIVGGATVAVLAVLLLEGRRRFLPRPALYLFYPGHLAALAGLRWLGG